MASWLQDINSGKSSSDLIALGTTRPPVSRYSNLHTDPRVRPSKVAKVCDLSDCE